MRNEIINLKNCKKIALMGGTFDPIHYGHLIVAETVLQKMSFDKIIFIPAGNPNFKQNNGVSLDIHRYFMTCLATLNNNKFEVSSIEIDRQGITYTYDTIKILKKLCSDDTEIFFIFGADVLDDFLNWYNIKELFNICKFILVNRAGYDEKEIKQKILELEKHNAHITIVDIPNIDISSTQIRESIKNNKSVKYLLPEPVENYINKNNLYKQNIIVNYLKEEIKKFLSGKRYNHTLGVLEEAIKLSKIYNVDEEKASVSAILHDIAKELPQDELRNKCQNYKIELDDIINEQIDLSHSFVGAGIAKEYFAIYDKEILDAIKYHTTGRPFMTTLEKIIFIADKIEPNRKPYEGLEEIRRFAYTDLDKAIIISLKGTIDFNTKKNRKIHKFSKDTLNQLL